MISLKELWYSNNAFDVKWETQAAYWANKTKLSHVVEVRGYIIIIEGVDGTEGKNVLHGMMIRRMITNKLVSQVKDCSQSLPTFGLTRTSFFLFSSADEYRASKTTRGYHWQLEELPTNRISVNVNILVNKLWTKSSSWSPDMSKHYSCFSSSSKSHKMSFTTWHLTR